MKTAIVAICLLLHVGAAMGCDYSRLRIVPGRGLPGVCELGMAPEEASRLNPGAYVNKDRSFVEIPHAGIGMFFGQLSYKDCTIITFNFKRYKMDGELDEEIFRREYGRDCKRFTATEAFPGILPPFHALSEITLENVQRRYGAYSLTLASRGEFFQYLRSSNSLSPVLIRIRDNDITILEYPELGFNVSWDGTNSAAASIQVYRPMNKSDVGREEYTIRGEAQSIFKNRVRYIAWRTLEGSEWNDKKRKWFISSVKYHSSYSCNGKLLKDVWVVWFSDENRNKRSVGGGREIVMDAKTFQVLRHLGGK